jgi:hypothetical protein
VSRRPRSGATEFLAIPLVVLLLGGLALLIVVAYSANWAWLLAAVPALAGAALVGWAIFGRSRPAADPPPVRPRDGGDAYRLLVIADESGTSDAFRDAVVPHTAGRAAEAYVIAPAQQSRLGRWTGDEAAYGHAQEHLDATLVALAALGIDAHGRVGSLDPIQAADDGLREFGADELVFVTGPGGDDGPDLNLIRSARGRYDLPVTHVVAGPTA